MEKYNILHTCTKRKICVFTILAQMLPFAFLHTGGKLYFYSLGTTV